jgi:RNA polymerase sigma factor for flagellar operon FliA
MHDALSTASHVDKAHLPTSEEMIRYDGIVRQVVARVLKKMSPNILRADLMAAGRIGLFDALRKGGNTQGVAFEVYARMRVQGAIVDELRAEDWLSRSARRKANAMGSEADAPVLFGFDDLSESALAPLLDTKVATALEQLEDAEETAIVAQAIALLPAREQLVLRLYYLNEVALGDVAATLCVSIARASQLKARGLDLLRAALAPPAVGVDSPSGAPAGVAA